MNIERMKQEIEYLQEYLTDGRMNKIEDVLNNRTRYITVVLEDIYHAHNASAVIRTCDCFGIQDLHVIENIKRNRLNKSVTQGASKWIDIKKYTEKENNTEEALLALNGYYRIFSRLASLNYFCYFVATI
jgi:tRNA (guanosine-2'-O-)-methyltransferase